jgi:cyclic pyranopterin phosphate synthase
MKDRFGRTIDYLRVSVTDQCNLRCRYCMPAGYEPPTRPEEMLSFAEITEVVGQAVGLGITRIRFTGGEPLVRPGLEQLVGMVAALPGLTDLALSTNGLLLGAQAAGLAAAGLRRVNISLDTLSPERYRALTRGGDLALVLAGIAAARAAGLAPVKLNCVVRRSCLEPDAQAVAAWAAEQGLEVRFIHRMDAASGTFSVVQGGAGGDCPRCSRLRLSCAGVVRPCLFCDQGFSVRELGAREALVQAVAQKPAAGGPCADNWIRAVGG